MAMCYAVLMARSGPPTPLPGSAAAPAPGQCPAALSVIMPAGSSCSGLQDAAGSLLKDAPADLELIVVADSSAAGIMASVSGLADADARVRVMHQAQALTPAAARNAGLAAATGDYVGFIEPGDAAEPGWARILLEAAPRQHPAIIKGEARIFQADRELYRPHSCAAMAQRTPLHWCGLMGSAIYRRSFVQHHGLHFAPECWGDDLDFQVRAVVAALLAGEQIALRPQAVCRLQQRGGAGARPDRSQAAAALRIYAALHALLQKHARQLPPAGVGMQYFAWITNLFDLARRAEHPEDAAAADAMAQRLGGECPAPVELERLRMEQELAEHWLRPHPV